jgi:hypothetical protein
LLSSCSHQTNRRKRKCGAGEPNGYLHFAWLVRHGWLCLVDVSRQRGRGELFPARAQTHHPTLALPAAISRLISFFGEAWPEDGAESDGDFACMETLGRAIHGVVIRSARPPQRAKSSGQVMLPASEAQFCRAPGGRTAPRRTKPAAPALVEAGDEAQRRRATSACEEPGGAGLPTMSRLRNCVTLRRRTAWPHWQGRTGWR